MTILFQILLIFRDNIWIATLKRNYIIKRRILSNFEEKYKFLTQIIKKNVINEGFLNIFLNRNLDFTPVTYESYFIMRNLLILVIYTNKGIK